MHKVAVSALWFSLYAQWLTIPVIILQSQVMRILGRGASETEAVTGLILAAGAFVALVAAPLAGALSDRKSSPTGRRRPFLIQGVLASSLALVLFGLFGPGDSLILYALAYLNLQFWWNWTAGPLAGLIPDVVPPGQQATASGWMNIVIILGMITGNALVRVLYQPNRLAPIIGVFIILSLLCLWVTLNWVTEQPPDLRPRTTGMPAFFRSFFLSPREYPDFYLVLGTRLLSNMGIWSTFGFMLFYLEKILGLPEDDATGLLATLLIMGACLSIPASLVGVKMANRFGVVFIVQLTSWIMAAATLCYVVIALHPAVVLVVPVVAAYSIGSGAYGAADWYLAMKVLPKGEDVGKDFGIWHVCMVLPQIIAPATIGVLIALVKTAASAQAAYELSFGIGAFWFILAALLVGRVRVAEAT